MAVPVHLPDPAASHHRNLLDLAQLLISPASMDGLARGLAVRLQHALNFDVVTLGLHDSGTRSLRLSAWNAGGVLRTLDSLPVFPDVNRWSWENQRSVLIQDLGAESHLPMFLDSLRKVGVRTYYVLPLTTMRQKLGAIGFGSLQVIPKTKQTIEFLHYAAAMIAEVLDTALSSDGRMAPTDCFQTPSVVTLEPEQEPRDFDLRDEPSRDEAFQEIVGD